MRENEKEKRGGRGTGAVVVGEALDEFRNCDCCDLFGPKLNENKRNPRYFRRKRGERCVLSIRVARAFACSLKWNGQLGLRTSWTSLRAVRGASEPWEPIVLRVRVGIPPVDDCGGFEEFEEEEWVGVP